MAKADQKSSFRYPPQRVDDLSVANLIIMEMSVNPSSDEILQG